MRLVEIQKIKSEMDAMERKVKTLKAEHEELYAELLKLAALVKDSVEISRDIDLQAEHYGKTQGAALLKSDLWMMSEIRVDVRKFNTQSLDLVQQYKELLLRLLERLAEDYKCVILHYGLAKVNTPLDFDLKYRCLL